MGLHSTVLYLFKQDGCPACKKALEQLEKFRETNSLAALTVCVNINSKDEVAGLRVKSTPTYVLVIDRQVAYKHEGALSAKQIQRLFETVRA